MSFREKILKNKIHKVIKRYFVQYRGRMIFYLTISSWRDHLREFQFQFRHKRAEVIARLFNPHVRCTRLVRILDPCPADRSPYPSFPFFLVNNAPITHYKVHQRKCGPITTPLSFARKLWEFHGIELWENPRRERDRIYHLHNERMEPRLYCIS